MTGLSKRRKFLLGSVLGVVSPLILDYFNLSLYPGVGVSLLVVVFTLYWAQGFRLGWREYLVLPLPLFLWVADYFLLIESLKSLGARFLLAVVAGVLLEVTFLTLNILSVATVRTVPLKKAALSALYALSLLFIFVLGVFLLRMRVEFLWSSYWWWFVLPLGVGAVALTFLSYASDKLRLRESAVLFLLAVELLASSVFWPAHGLMRVVFWVGIVFLMLAVMQHDLNRDLSLRQKREYLLIGLILVLAFLLG